MDGLDLLKKDWNKQDKNHKHWSQNDLYAMLHKKSSSIVKTLFYISIAELVFWIIINTLPQFFSTEYKENLDALYGNSLIFTELTIFSYGIILLFIYLLFKSHQAISVTDSAKKLMKSIIKTRKIIKYYVIYNLVLAFISIAIGMFYAINHNPELTDQFAHFNNGQLAVFTVISILLTGIFILIIWLFYRLIYGWLLKRLNQNYRELEKLEI
tara:strand:- start:258 stop:893 length:636 start_codon:yes stop_codon:yes gene_type:complete